MFSLSVIICCYNSELRIAKTLENLNLLILPESSDIEIILVDNGCTDNTVQLALKTWENLKSKISLRIIEEKKQGLSNARAKGIASAVNKWILFCDDDNYVEPNYISEALKLEAQFNNVGIIGGRGIPVFESYIPDWWNDAKCWYACGELQEFSGEINAVNGACMMIRKLIFDLPLFKINFFLSDRLGDDLISGGDLEICKRAKLSGFCILYSNESVYGHYMPNSRLNKEYLFNLLKGIGKGFVLLKIYDTKVRSKAYELLKFIYGIIRFCILNEGNNWGLSKYQIIQIRTDSFIFFLRKRKNILFAKKILDSQK